MSSYARKGTVVGVVASITAGTLDAPLGVAKPMMAYRAPARGLTATFNATRKKKPMLTEFRMSVSNTGNTNAVSRRA